MLEIYIERNWKFLFLLIIIIIMGIIIIIVMGMGIIREWIKEMIYLEVNKW